MSINPLNDISKVYLEQIAEASVKERAAKAVDHQRKGTHGDDDELEQLQGDVQKSINKLKKRRVTRASASLAARRVQGDVERSNNYGPQRPKPGTVTGRRIEEPEPTGSKPKGYRTEEIGINEAKKRKVKRWWDDDGDGIGYEKGEVSGKFKRKKVKESSDYDPMDDDEFDHDEAEENRGVSGKNNPKGGKALGKKKKGMKEGFSNWRQDLVEIVATDDEDQKKIDVKKKINNKIKTSAMGGGIKLGEAVEQIGGTLIEMVQIDNILDDFTDYEIDLLSDSLIEKVVEEVFYNYLEEGYDAEEIEDYICESIDISLSILNEAKVTFGHDTPNTEKKEGVLQKIKGAVKKVGKAVARGVGYAAGAAVRGAKAVGREAKSGYERGRSGSSSGETSRSSASSRSSAPSTSSSSDSGSEGGEKKPGILSRVASKLKKGLKKAVAKGARAVSRGARNVARKMEGGETKKAEAPKAAPKKAEKPADPWGEPTTPPKAKAKPKASTKKTTAPKAKAPAKKKKTSKLDDLLATVRSESVWINEMPYQVYGSPDGKKEKKIGKPVKSKKYADARAAELEDTHKATGGQYRSQYVKNSFEPKGELVDEKTLTDAEMKKREEIIKSMKGKAEDFERRYPGRGREVMYATATKMAKRIEEQALDEIF